MQRHGHSVSEAAWAALRGGVSAVWWEGTAVKLIKRMSAKELGERVRELDRLYLAHDAAANALHACRNAKDRPRLKRAARRAWKRYTTLRDAAK